MEKEFNLLSQNYGPLRKALSLREQAFGSPDIVLDEDERITGFMLQEKSGHFKYKVNDRLAEHPWGWFFIGPVVLNSLEVLRVAIVPATTADVLRFADAVAVHNAWADRITARCGSYFSVMLEHLKSRYGEGVRELLNDELIQQGFEPIPRFEDGSYRLNFAALLIAVSYVHDSKDVLYSIQFLKHLANLCHEGIARLDATTRSLRASKPVNYTEKRKRQSAIMDFSRRSEEVRLFEKSINAANSNS